VKAHERGLNAGWIGVHGPRSAVSLSA
jgi:hypothetical protein